MILVVPSRPANRIKWSQWSVTMVSWASPPQYHNTRMRLRGQILLLYLLLCLQTASNYAQWHKNGGGIGLEEVRCPSVYTLGTGPGSCVCQAASDGLDFSCESEVPPGTSLEQVRAVVSAAKFAIKSLVVSMLDSNRTMLPDKTFANGSISQITIKASNLTDVADDAFEGTHQRLHTLAIHNRYFCFLYSRVSYFCNFRRKNK